LVDLTTCHLKFVQSCPNGSEHEAAAGNAITARINVLRANAAEASVTGIARFRAKAVILPKLACAATIIGGFMMRDIASNSRMMTHRHFFCGLS
jgi:hypothetical protein